MKVKLRRGMNVRAGDVEGLAISFSPEFIIVRGDDGKEKAVRRSDKDVALIGIKPDEEALEG